MSGSPRIAAIRRNAATNARGSSARITPRLPARIVGLSTHGYVARSGRRLGIVGDAEEREPRGAHARPGERLAHPVLVPRASDTASTELDRRPRRSAMAAPTTVVRSSTGTTASTAVAPRELRDGPRRLDRVPRSPA